MIQKILKRLNRITPAGKPSFIIVGAQKAGTTSLHYYLNQHPRLSGSKPKEVGFFDMDHNFEKGERWYHSHFKDYRSFYRKLIYFESTPQYLYREGTAERIHQYNPNLKIIILLREPVSRAYSSWNMYRDFREGGKKFPEILYINYTKDKQNNLIKELYTTDQFPSFEDCVQSEIEKIKNGSSVQEPSFLRRGIYYDQIKKYHTLFGKENVLVIGFREFIQHKKQTLNAILSLLGVEPSDWEFLREESKNVRSYPGKINPETEQLLKEFYQPYNEQLFAYLGYKLNW